MPKGVSVLPAWAENAFDSSFGCLSRCVSVSSTLHLVLGRSLNAEIVHRLERSLNEEESLKAARPSGTRAGNSGSGESLEGRGMSRKRLRLGVVGLVALVLIAVAAMMGGLRGSTTSGQTVSAEFGETPPALAKHLAKLGQALPPNGGMSEEGPGGAAGGEFAERAYPDATISVAEMEGARDAFAAATSRSGGKGAEWEQIGPSRALYPSSQFLNSFLYVPNEYIAGGRTTSIAIEDECVQGDCEAYIAPAGGGVWRTKNAARRTRSSGHYLGGPLGHQRHRRSRDRPERPERRAPSTSAPARPTSAAPAAWPGPACTGRPTAGHLDGRSARPSSQGKGVGEILVPPGDPNTLYVASTTALRGMSSVCCSGVTRPVPGAAKWGLYKSTDGGATWGFIHNGSANVADCTGALTEFNNGSICSPRGVRDIAFDPTNAETIYASSYARGVWRSTDAGATGCRSSRRSTRR